MVENCLHIADVVSECPSSTSMCRSNILLVTIANFKEYQITRVMFHRQVNLISCYQVSRGNQSLNIIS